MFSTQSRTLNMFSTQNRTLNMFSSLPVTSSTSSFSRCQRGGTGSAVRLPSLLLERPGPWTCLIPSFPAPGFQDSVLKLSPAFALLMFFLSHLPSQHPSLLLELSR